jgi:FkbM family methyltransferase
MMLTTGTVLRASRMPFLYANFVAAYRNRALPYEDAQGHVEYRLRNGLRLIAAPGPHDVRIINEIWIDGEYAVKNFIPEPSWNILDLGANKGYYAAWALTKAPTARVHCYEPDPQNVAALRVNIAPFARCTSVRQAAVGSSAGSLTLFRIAGRGGQGSLYRARASLRGQIVAEVDVPVVSFSEVIKRAGYVDLLKIDVEGAEYDILLDSPPESFDHVQRITVEADPVDPCRSDRRTSDLFRHLTRHGFSQISRKRSVLFLARERVGSC